jgi:anaerobic magnesium-protoporphyrin IX monomethyl ester cyclase
MPTSNITPSSVPKEVLIVFGIPGIRLSTVEKEGVPLSNTIKQLLGNDALVHFTYPGLGPAVIAAYLKKHGISVVLKDWYLDIIDASNYDIIGISGTHLNLTQLQEIIKSIRYTNPKATIIVGGPSTSTYSLDMFLSAIPEINYVVFNEGEKSFHELIEALTHGLDVATINGIGYLKNNIAFKTPPRDPLNPNEICSPDWSIVDMSQRLPLLSLETARGCTYNCAYCFEVNFWGKPIRFRNLQSIIDEIINNYLQYNITTYRFADSCFTAPEERCMEICDQLIYNFINHHIPLKWSCYARINNLNDQLLAKMKLAGCVAICVGMESGEPSILKKMNKLYSPEQIIHGISIAKKHGIITHCNIIVGFPGETNETIKNTIRTLNLAAPNTFHCMLLDIAPNTTLSQNKPHYGIKGDRLNWEHSSMSSNDALSAITKIMTEVIPSCHVPMGDVITILLISAGYAADDVKSFFNSIASGTAKKKELDMINIAVRRYMS